MTRNFLVAALVFGLIETAAASALAAPRDATTGYARSPAPSFAVPYGHRTLFEGRAAHEFKRPAPVRYHLDDVPPIAGGRGASDGVV